MSNPTWPVEGSPTALSDQEAAAGPREESWRIELLNLQDISQGVLDGVTGGSLTLNVNAASRRGGSLAYSGASVDWSKVRVRPVYVWTGIDGVTREIPCGVLIPASPGRTFTDGAVTQTVDLYDKTDLLAQDALPSPFQISAGANVVAAIRSLINGAGELRHQIEDSTATARTTQVWDAGTSRLTIIQDLIDGIGYQGLYTDPLGIFRSGPYVPPTERPVVWAFADDANSILSPGMGLDADTYSVANRVICISTGTGDVAAMVAKAEDDDPASPTSHASRGRWVTRVVEGVEATTQTVLNALATRYLAEEKRVAKKWTVQHAPVPVDLQDAVTVSRVSDGQDVQFTATVEQLEYSLEVGALVRATLKEVQ